MKSEGDEQILLAALYVYKSGVYGGENVSTKIMLTDFKHVFENFSG